LEHTF